MNKKTREWIWIIVGVYLTYTGIQLITDVMKEKQGGYIGFVIAGALFAVFGVGCIVAAVKRMTEPSQEPDEDEAGADEDMQEEINQIEEEARKEAEDDREDGLDH